MKTRGSELVARALEDEGVRFTFGIPGTHNIELYDALERSTVRPVLVTDEQSASFMADAVSRSSGSVGVVNVVPGAGLTHALSGIAEAFMDNVPLVAILCGIRSDTGRAFQLHDIDQAALVAPVTKGYFKPASADEIYPLVRRAFALARSGCPGPVAVEIPADFYLVTQSVDGPAATSPAQNVRDAPSPSAAPIAPNASNDGELAPPAPGDDEIARAASILSAARRPLIYAGRGAEHATGPLLAVAEALSAPVATTVQGKGVFPESHPLWLWNGLGRSTPAYARKVFEEADAMLAIGCRFSEVATASYGFTPPSPLIHVDVDATVLDRNYTADLAVAADAGAFLDALVTRLDAREAAAGLRERIREGRLAVREKQRAPSTDGVTPAVLFDELQAAAGDGAIYTADSGNGTFLAMEHLELDAPGRFLAPVDYSCMGYAIPAALGAKLANPGRDVIALAGDGALLMTGLELLTAKATGAAPLVCVLRDEELGQIAQFQRTALNRDTCSVLADFELSDYARLVGAEFLAASEDGDVRGAVRRGLEIARGGRAAVVEVAIDYSRKTFFTKGVVTTNLLRLPWGDRARMVGRLLARKARLT